METEKKRGRPTKAPTPGERASLGLRVTAEMKEKLDRAASQNGRSQSQEAEYRLERSFADDGLYTSSEMRLWAVMLAGVFAQEGRFQARMQDESRIWSDADWMSDPLIYQSAMFAVIRNLIRNMPSPSRENVRLYMLQIAAKFQAMERELLGTNQIVAEFAPKELDNGER